MNKAQQEQQVLDEDLRTRPEARAARTAVLEKVKTWMPHGGYEVWGEECFRRLWLSYREQKSWCRFKDILHEVLWPRYGNRRFGSSVDLGLPSRRWSHSRTDDEFEELVEDWCNAVSSALVFPPQPKETRLSISNWIEAHIDSGAIDWHRRGASYWSEWYRRAEQETTPPCFWPGVMPVRAKAKTWSFFQAILVEKAGAFPRHLAPGWGEVDIHQKDVGTWIRRARYLFRAVKEQPGAARGHDPIQDYGQLVGRMLNGAMHRMTKDLGDDCVDNYRFAALDRPGDLRRYRMQRRQGCCGFHDEIVVISGIRYTIGCNYGH
jgi:hypothetical protein